MKIGYGKLGRSMALSLGKCGSVGGDHEPLAVLIQLAQRHPEDTFYVLGRNTLENPSETPGLPQNIRSPWFDHGWANRLRKEIARIQQSRTLEQQRDALSVNEQIQLRDVFNDITGSAFTTMDGHVWWVGQHGSSNSPIPRIDDRTKLTKPQDWCTYYASFVLNGINAWRNEDPFTREEVWLNADPRNNHKMRDLKWPLRNPILTQFDFINQIKHERYGDERHPSEVSGDDSWRWGKIADRTFETTEVWKSTVCNIYSRIEMCSLVPGTPSGDLVQYSEEFERPGQFGLFINEARSNGIPDEKTRRFIMDHWVLPLDPTFVHGAWSPGSMLWLQNRWPGLLPFTSLPPSQWDGNYYRLLHSVRCTFTTPTSGSGWATTKPWEAFAAGTVCFFHPDYDTQDNILGDAPTELRDWLRVKTPEQLKQRINIMNSDKATFEWLVRAQRAHFDNAIMERPYLRMIEERLYGSSG